MYVETMPEKLIVNYLEMTSPAQFNPGFIDDPAVEIVHATPDVGFYRYLYRAVGEECRWRDRNYISDSELNRILTSPTNTVLLAYVDGIPAGFIELEDEGQDTRIMYFGLRPEFGGRGLGKHLLSHGVEQAWANGAKRIYLDTCNLDHPVALRNYERRGFRIYETIEKPMPQRYE